jgi:hypothetical protein
MVDEAAGWWHTAATFRFASTQLLPRAEKVEYAKVDLTTLPINRFNSWITTSIITSRYEEGARFWRPYCPRIRNNHHTVAHASCIFVTCLRGMDAFGHQRQCGCFSKRSYRCSWRARDSSGKKNYPFDMLTSNHYGALENIHNAAHILGSR